MISERNIRLAISKREPCLQQLCVGLNKIIFSRPARFIFSSDFFFAIYFFDVYFPLALVSVVFFIRAKI